MRIDSARRRTKYRVLSVLLGLSALPLHLIGIGFLCGILEMPIVWFGEPEWFKFLFVTIFVGGLILVVIYALLAHILPLLWDLSHSWLHDLWWSVKRKREDDEGRP